MSLKDWNEFREFRDKAVQKLTYYDTVVLIVNEEVEENKVFRNDIFQFAETSPYNEMHLCLKDVVYTIDFHKLGIPCLYIPIALRFNLEDGLVPTPSREALLYSSATIQLIKNKITLAADYMINKYNEQTYKYNNILDAWDNIGTRDKYIKLEERSFECRELEQYSQFTFKKIKVEGINIKEPNYYKQLKFELLQEFTHLAYDRNNFWKKKHLYNNFANSLRDNYVDIVQFDNPLAGKVKTFFREKYNHALYVTKNKPFTLKNYRGILLLGKDDRENWRNRIKEFQEVQRQILDKRLINENDVELSKEYQDWLVENKRISSEKRKETVKNGEYAGLGKERGDITLGKIRAHKHGGKACITKTVKKIELLGNEKKLCVYMEKDSIDSAEQYRYFLAFPSVDFIELNKTEIKHVEKLQNWKNMNEFKESKPFARLVTALEIDKLERIIPDNEEVIFETFPKYQKLKERLEKYKSENVKGYADDEVEEIFLQFAKDNNMYDFSIWSEVQEFRKLMLDFGFLNYLNINNFDNLGDEEQKIIKNMVYIILKQKRISCKFVDEFELVDKVPAEVYKQEEEKELILQSV